LRGPAPVSARVLAHARAAALGISALVVEVTASGPPGQVRVGLDYKSFAQAYGGNYGSRLRLRQRSPPGIPGGRSGLVKPCGDGAARSCGGARHRPGTSRAAVRHPTALRAWPLALAAKSS
jgi:hypothetical protein